VRLFSRFGARSLVGLDIGSSSVKAVELAPAPDGFDLLRVGTAPVPPESIVQGAFLNSGAIVEAIGAALEDGKIRAQDVCTAVSGHSVIVKKIALPKMSQEELEESIRWEAEQYIPFDVNEVNLDFQILSEAEGEEQMDVLLVAVKKDLIDDYVQVLGEARLRPAIIDVAAFAVQNAYEANYGTSEEVTALVHIGAQTVHIDVVQGGMPLFTRDVSAGGNQYTEEIQKVLSLGFEEAERMKIGGSGSEEDQEVVPQEVEEAMRSVTESLVGEIARSIEFFSATAAGNDVTRAVLSGGSAQVPGLDKAFHERTGLPVSIMNPLARMRPNKRFDPERLEELGPRLGVGIGLALRRLDDR